MSRIEIKGQNKLTANECISIDFYDDKKFHLHLWRQQSNGSRVGTSFSHPQALRSYALGLLEMAHRFEAAVKPEWLSRNGEWLQPEECQEAAGWSIVVDEPTLLLNPEERDRVLKQWDEMLGSRKLKIRVTP